jgi:hypothetical protein
MNTRRKIVASHKCLQALAPGENPLLPVTLVGAKPRLIRGCPLWILHGIRQGRADDCSTDIAKMRRAGLGRARPLAGGIRSRISPTKVAAAKTARRAPPSIAMIRAGGQAVFPEQSLAVFHRSTALSKSICRFDKFSGTTATVRRSLKWRFSPVKRNAAPIANASRGMPEEFARR